MENKNQTLWIVLGLVVVALIVVFAVTMGNKDKVPAENNTGENQTETTAGPASTLDTTDAAATTGGTAVTIAYEDALIKYADRRLQFNDMCQATPNTVTYKDNSGIMLDNRSATTRSIKIGANTYAVKGYGFRIVTLPDTYRESSKYFVDCGVSQNVATILVQE
jgi:hypothetical protein